MSGIGVPANVFRAYDIRGELGDIHPDLFRLITRTFVTRFLGGPGAKVVLGRDLRTSSEELAEAAAEGLMEAGAEVWDIGVVPTPLAYFAMGRWKASGGVVVTASHNPPQYNGMKLRVKDEPFYGEDLQRLYQAVLEAPEPVDGGMRVQRDAYADYFAVAQEYLRLQRPLKVVLDLGNGAGTLTAPRLLSELGCELELLFPDPDGGQFQGRGPDPMADGALDSLCERVKNSDAAFGLAIDADGDRLAVVDEEGRPVTADRAVIPICQHLLDGGAKTFVADMRCTRTTIEYVQARGGQVIKAKCGYPYILRAMACYDAAFGFETTGHYFFANPDIKFDDATFAAAFFCQVMSASDRSVAEIMASAPTYYTAKEVRRNCPDEVKFKVVERLAEDYGREFVVDTTDGVRVERPEGWALVRASNTAPQITMRWEGRTKADMEAIGEELKERVKAVMEEFGVPVEDDWAEGH